MFPDPSDENLREQVLNNAATPSQPSFPPPRVAPQLGAISKASLQSTRCTMNIPCVPSKPLMQQGGVIKVNIKMLHLDDKQIEEIQRHYETNTHFSELYSDDVKPQQAASYVLREQKLDLRNLANLGNGWSIRWTTRGGTGAKEYTRHLLQW
ncbi:hypothetical protein JB92DRAFT_3106351 [Gautieria morchelliformis]|nr:hypothetical protein JB92DRAFT_3106351 [Gautieria morchelliformis]